MRKLTLSLLFALFLPGGSVEAYLEAARKANRWDFAKCGLVALLVFFLLEDGVVIYTSWLITAIAFGVYQYVWVFSYPMTRPVLYEETSLVFLLLILGNQAAFALLCGAGWLGFGLLAVCWFAFGRIIGRFAVAKEVRTIYGMVCEDYPQETADARIDLAEEMLAARITDVRSL